MKEIYDDFMVTVGDLSEAKLTIWGSKAEESDLQRMLLDENGPSLDILIDEGDVVEVATANTWQELEQAAFMLKGEYNSFIIGHNGYDLDDLVHTMFHKKQLASTVMNDEDIVEVGFWAVPYYISDVDMLDCYKWEPMFNRLSEYCDPEKVWLRSMNNYNILDVWYEICKERDNNVGK